MSHPQNTKVLESLKEVFEDMHDYLTAAEIIKEEHGGENAIVHDFPDYDKVKEIHSEIDK